MKKRYALFFPGQGSQYIGMARDLYEDSSEIRDLFAIGSDRMGRDLAELIFTGPVETLTQTAYCQVALYAAGLACWRWFSKHCSILPVAAAGHSLGEYVALTAGGAISAEVGFTLVAERGRLMQEAADSSPGKMVAVLGKSEEEILALVRESPGVEIANYNSIGQTVAGGSEKAISAFLQLLKERGIKAIPLPVSGAFHTSLMRSAQEAFLVTLEKVDFSSPLFPVYANCTGKAVHEPEEIRSALGRQIVESVRWVHILQAFSLLSLDAFVELGPKNVLCGLAKRTVPEVQAFHGEDISSIQEVISLLST